MKITFKERKIFERNISLSYITGALMWGRFFLPVLALFYIASQVSLSEFAIIMSVFSLAILLLEIPTGVVADLIGKKNTLLLSRAMYIIEIALIAFFNGFWVFLGAKVISGIGVSLGSGTNSALIYDSLKKIGKEKEHKKVVGKLNFISNIAMAFVFIIGAYLFAINNKLPAIASLPLIILGFILTFFLKEPYNPVKKFNFNNLFVHLKEGIRYFVNQKYLVYLAFFTFFIGSAISMILSLSSAYFKVILIPTFLIGTVAFVSNLLTAYSSKKAYFFEKKFGEKLSLSIIQIISFVSVLLMSFVIPYYGVLFYLLLTFMQGFYEVIIVDYTNRHVKTSHRATMLSINNMFDNIGIFLLFPVLGYLIKSYSMGFSLMFLGIFLFACFVVSIIWYKNIQRSK
jgi:MFS family permease